MNPMTRTLFELRADKERNPGGTDNAEPDYLLTGIEDEADRNLSAAAELFDLDTEALEERAAIIQYDGGAARVTACRLAVAHALRERASELSDRVARWIFNNAAAILDWEKANYADREQTFQAMLSCLESECRESTAERREAG
jgi:hypothetical protein